MSEYKVGDKFVIEIGEVYNNGLPFNGKSTPCDLYRIEGFNSLVFDENGLDRLNRLDSDYVNEYFGELQDEAYKQGMRDALKDSFNVGDVVKVKNGYEFVVTHISEGTHLFGITETGDTYTAIHKTHCEKTGKHIDIQNILSQIGA